jgi:hypothetical protein
MGAMHSKLMLLKYEKYLRVVVPTGNLMSYDWGETGTMENVGYSAVDASGLLKGRLLTDGVW